MYRSRNGDGRGLLGVCASIHVGIRSLGQFIHDCSLDINEVACCTVVHERVPAKGEGVIVCWCDGSSRGSSNVAEEDSRLGIGTDREEVGVVPGGLYGLVQCRPESLVDVNPGPLYPVGETYISLGYVGAFRGAGSLKVGLG